VNVVALLFNHEDIKDKSSGETVLTLGQEMVDPITVCQEAFLYIQKTMLCLLQRTLHLT